MMVIFCDLNVKNVFKCPKRWLSNHVWPLHNFIKNNSIGLAMFAQVATYFDHKYNKIFSI
jgi:hypothetical protein